MNVIRKRLLASLALFAALAMIPAGIYAGKKGKGKMVFPESVHDFGTVKENGGPVSCEFEFVNEGNANLIIIEAAADCGCTRPEYPKAPVAPGKKGKVKVTYNPLGRPGSFDKVVTIKTNGSPSKVRLKVRGSVMPKK